MGSDTRQFTAFAKYFVSFFHGFQAQFVEPTLASKDPRPKSSDTAASPPEYQEIKPVPVSRSYSDSLAMRTGCLLSRLNPSVRVFGHYGMSVCTSETITHGARSHECPQMDQNRRR